MITHNGKQVTLAMRNRKAINLIARNGKAMFGEYAQWLHGIDAAAKAVILAEYGKQVWSDVKQYAKAHPQIVEFINQDPHLAASISPNSNKVRRVRGNAKTYVTLGDYDWGNISYDIEAWLYTINEFDKQLIGGSTWSYNSWITQIMNSKLCNTMCDGSTGVTIISNDISIKQENGEVTFQGVTKPRNATFTGIKTVYLFGAGNAHLSDSGVSRLRIQSNDHLTDDADLFVPYLSKDGTVDLLNARTGVLAQRSGELTLEVTDKA